MNTVRLTKNDEQRFRAFCDYEKIVYITIGELQIILQRLKIRNTSANLLRNGILESVYRGKVYRVSGKNGTAMELLPKIFNGEQFFLYGAYAYNLYGFIEQLPAVYQVANLKTQKDKTIAGFNFNFRKANKDYFYGIDIKTNILSRERALIDFCKNYGYMRFMDIFSKNTDTLDIDKIIGYALKYPVKNISRRVLYGINTTRQLPDRIIKKIPRESLITLTELKTRKGKIDKIFNIIINQQ